MISVSVIKKKFQLALMSAGLLLAGGCEKFLEVEPPISKVLTSAVFSDESAATAAMAGIYLEFYSGGSNGALGSGGQGSLAIAVGFMSDELHHTSQSNPTLVELEQNRIVADNGNVLSIWTAGYKIIYQCNSLIEGLSKSKSLPPAAANQLTGEALFIRAFCHFYLANTYGDVPLVITTSYSTNAKVTRTPQATLFAQVEADLLQAEGLLTDAYPSEYRARINKNVVSAFLARFYLYQKNWVKAEERATSVISLTDVYDLPSNLNDVFLKGSVEAIWQMMPGDLSQYTNEAYAFGSTNGLSNNTVRSVMVERFNDADKRKINWVAVYPSGDTSVYLPYKLKNFYLLGTPSNEWSHGLRLAEQFLIRAEARAQQGKISGENSAISDINRLRSRAGIPDTAATNLAQMMGIVDLERRHELFTEWGHRWYDLKRWGKLTATLAPIKPGWSENDTIMPLPGQEMRNNPFLKPQNLGY